MQTVLQRDTTSAHSTAIYMSPTRLTPLTWHSYVQFLRVPSYTRLLNGELLLCPARMQHAWHESQPPAPSERVQTPPPPCSMSPVGSLLLSPDLWECLVTMVYLPTQDRPSILFYKITDSHKLKEKRSVHWPGATTFTLIFFFATSLARARENPTNPPLLALYTDWPELPFRPTTLPRKRSESKFKPHS